MNIAIGYSYSPGVTGAYMQKALESRMTTTYVGTPWAARAGFAVTGNVREIVTALPDRPDLYLYIDSGEPYFPRGLTDLECPTACYLIDVHLRADALLKQAMFFDYAFTAQREFVDRLRQAGHPQAHWLPLACDPDIHRPYDLPKRYDIGFVGSTRQGYERRRVLVERLARRFTMNDYHRTTYTPTEMSRIYSESRLIFNCSLRREVNMRAFEGPATGTLLLTDRIGNGLAELFVDREHVVMYDDSELVDVAEEFLRENARRERIARQGYEHVLAHHTYGHRVDAILHTVFASDSALQLLAPMRSRTDADVQIAYAELFALMGRVDDTIAQFILMPHDWRYQARAGKQLALCMMRRTRYLLKHVS